jgi:phage-related protein (TIGR01555 family)
MPSKKVTRKKPVAPKASTETTDSKKPAVSVDAMTVFRAEAQMQKSQVQEIFKTTDGFDNFVSRVGLRNDNTLSYGTYEFNLITRNRTKLEAAYRGSWVVGAVVDSIAEDMTRAGLDITVDEDKSGDVRKIQSSISRLQLWQSICKVIKWGRLYGGSIGVIQIEGQDVSTPLDVETIKQGQFRGIIDFDRWMVNPVIQNPIDSGPEMGLPSFYTIVNSPDEQSPTYKPSSIDGENVHYTRVIRYAGIDLPYFQAITEMMWGESVLERLWDRLICFDNATMSAGSLIDRANLRTVQIEGLREVLAAGAEATTGLYAQFDMMRQLQVNEGLTLLDKNDVFSSTAYSFAGLSDMLLQFGQQLAGATEIPLVRLFGQSPAGLSATGDADMRMYYDNIKARQEARLRNGWETLLKVLWFSELGKPPPDDMTFEFKSLWQMSATDKANNAKTTTETILGAFEAGVTDRKTALLELRDASPDTGLFGSITDEDIEEADADEPPLPDVEPGASSAEPKETKEKAKSTDGKSRWNLWK